MNFMAMEVLVEGQLIIKGALSLPDGKETGSDSPLH
jgi:hypothetical protein